MVHLLVFSHVALLAFVVSLASSKPIRPNQIGHRSNTSRNISSRAESESSHVVEELSEGAYYALAEVTIGISTKKLMLLVSTSSSLTWVKKESLDFEITGNETGTFDVDSPDIAPPDEDSQSADSALVLSGANSPNEGQVKGKRYALQITVGGKLVIEDQEIGIADEYGDEIKNTQWDGIMGLNIYTREKGKYPPNLIQSLAKAGTIAESLGLSFIPLSADDTHQLTWGGYDSSRMTGELSTVKLSSKKEATERLHWTIDASIKYNGETIQELDAAFLDTSSTTITLTAGAYEKFKKATGARPSGNIMKISSAEYKKMKDLEIVIGGKSYPLTPNALKEPIEDEEDDGNSGKDEELLIDEITSSGDLFAFGLGMPFFSRYNVHLDGGKDEVGIGFTEYTNSN